MKIDLRKKLSDPPSRLMRSVVKSTKNAFCNYDLMMTMMKPCCQIYRAKMHFPIEILLGQAFFTVEYYIS